MDAVQQRRPCTFVHPCMCRRWRWQRVPHAYAHALCMASGLQRMCQGSTGQGKAGMHPPRTCMHVSAVGQALQARHATSPDPPLPVSPPPPPSPLPGPQEQVVYDEGDEGSAHRYEFFEWLGYSEECELDCMAEWIRDDIWPDPLPYYSAPGVSDERWMDGLPPAARTHACMRTPCSPACMGAAWRGVAWPRHAPHVRAACACMRMPCTMHMHICESRCAACLPARSWLRGFFLWWWRG